MSDYKDYLYPLANGVKALVVMATDQECGDALKKMGIKPLITGVGPIQAASALTHALTEMQYARPPIKPDIIINLGSAGSKNLDQGEIYAVSESSYRDMDASKFGFEKGATPFSPYPATLHLPVIPSLKKASCSTGGNVVSDYASVTADMVEMEFSAYLDVAMKFGIPILGLKGISDGKTPLSGHYEEWAQLLPKIDERLAATLNDIKTGLSDGSLKKEALCKMPAEWDDKHAGFRRQIALS